MRIGRGRNGWKLLAPMGAGLAALAGVSGAVVAARRKRQPAAGEEAVDWIDGLSTKAETALLEAAEAVEERIGTLPDLPPRERQKVDSALERARMRISEASENLLFKLGGPTVRTSSHDGI